VSCNTKQNVCTEAAWCWQAPAAPPWDSFLRHDRLVVSFLPSESLTLPFESMMFFELCTLIPVN